MFTPADITFTHKTGHVWPRPAKKPAMAADAIAGMAPRQRMRKYVTSSSATAGSWPAKAKNLPAKGIKAMRTAPPKIAT